MPSYEHRQRLKIMKLEESRNSLFIGAAFSLIAICVASIGIDAAAHHLPQIAIEAFPNSDLANNLTKEAIERFKDNINRFGVPSVAFGSAASASLGLILNGRINAIVRKIVKSRRPEDYREYTRDEKKEYFRNGKEQVAKEIKNYKKENDWDRNVPRAKKR